MCEKTIQNECPELEVNISGGSTGPAGPPNTLTVGTVTSLPAGSTPTVTITGSSPTQTINFGLTVGNTGAAGSNGSNGPPNVLSIGTVTTLSPGSSATASITGSSPTQVLNLGIPQGNTGAAGSTLQTFTFNYTTQSAVGTASPYTFTIGMGSSDIGVGLGNIPTTVAPGMIYFRVPVGGALTDLYANLCGTMNVGGLVAFTIYRGQPSGGSIAFTQVMSTNVNTSAGLNCLSNYTSAGVPTIAAGDYLACKVYVQASAQFTAATPLSITVCVKLTV